MRMSATFPGVLATVLLAATVLGPFASAALSATGLAPLKQLQAIKMAREPLHERREARERHEELRKLVRLMKKKGITQFSTAGLRKKPAVLETDAARGDAAPTTLRPAQRTAATAPPVSNKRANNPAGDTQAGAGQSETSIVAWGNKVIAAWNDGEGFATDPPGPGQGYGTSTDGGITWVDRGDLPVGSLPDWVWTSDPVLAVNERSGAFYFTALFDANGAGAIATTSGLGIIKGRMNNNGTMVWSTPVSIRTVSNSADFIDKQWVVADSSSGKVYVTYTRFPTAGSVINFNASSDSNVTSWPVLQTISSVAENGLVQGSRPIVAGRDTVYVQYYKIGLVDVDFIRVRRSTTAGASFSAGVDAVSFYSNFGSGAPGFNRDFGVQFAGFAVDRSRGPRRGRLYLSFNESMNWYDDEPSIGTGGTLSETEGNGTVGTANAFTVGQILSGDVGTGDADYFSTPLTAGQSVIFESSTAPGTGTSNITLRLFAPNGTTRLALTTAFSGTNGVGVFMFTAPSAGTYFFRVAANGATGAYTIKTGSASNTGERGRDQRDVFVSYSDNGATWATPVRVSQSPIGFDDWLPEVAVDANGRAYCSWFDFRDAAAATSGGQSNTYLAFSDDGGANWSETGATSDATSDWTNVVSNIAPNQGDYIALFANATNLYACWGDGRDGNPNVYVAPWTVTYTIVPPAPALVSATASLDRVDLEWLVDAPAGFEATVERAEGGAFVSLGTIQSDAQGRLRYADLDVIAGHTYQYRLAVLENDVVRYYGATSLTVPLQLSFALGSAFPNPAAADFTASFTLASSQPATLSLVDVTGRVVLSRALTLGPGRHVLPLSGTLDFAAGVYLLRLEQGDRSLTQRISLLR
ncbi:MAG: T9SS type A sorting domain-containing protein [Candidatus Eisenbacteria bacterium]